MRVLSLVKRLAAAWLKLGLGILGGLVLLEATLRANPALLLRGMALPAPVDPPIMTQTYDVRPSDADLFFWVPDLIRPIPPERDKVEAHVVFETDEYGFPNAAPLPPKADIVVLGRSFSLGAQSSEPWPRALSRLTGFSVLNLSQGASGIDLKRDYLERFGLLRHPRWVIVEVLPSMDIMGYTPIQPTLVQGLVVPAEQEVARQGAQVGATSDVNPIFPLEVDIPGRRVELTFFSYYMAALTADRPMILASQQWATYSRHLREMDQEVRASGACLVLLYAPTKPDIYFPLAVDPQQLGPALTGVKAWRLNDQGWLVEDPEVRVDVRAMQAIASTAREIVSLFARQEGWLFVDPTAAMTQAALEGESPFMAIDTHWSDLGHQLVAQVMASALEGADCP
jgi:hypothetical protein